MPKVIYFDPTGKESEEEVEEGYTLMEGAYNQQIPGMLAECGGAAACGTCHSYIENGWIKKLPEIEDLEDAMLFAIPERQANSRLTCQIYMTEELNGIVVRIADN